MWYGCRCTRTGWMASDDPEVWVCYECQQPSPMVIEGESMRTDVNLMRGGDHHNELVDTKELCQNREFNWIIDYKWTPEVIVGSESGRKARVWVHKDHPSLSTDS